MEVIYPMFAMVVLTAIVGGMTAYIRISSAYSGKVNPKYFRLMANYDIPESVAKFGRNFNNLFEVPTLFYAACLAYIALNLTSSLFLLLAWLFVALRVVHSLIHLTYNNPLHRFLPFFLSLLCVLSMWVQLVMQVGSLSGQNV